MIIGLVGQPSAGKDTLAGYFQAKGFRHISTGDIIRQEMQARRIPLDRESMRRFTSMRRSEEGSAYPISLVLQELGNGDSVISGMRNIAEIEELRRIFGDSFRLVAVTADSRVRWERSKARDREGDEISYEEFLLRESKERAGEMHQNDAVIDNADYVIDNSGNEEALAAHADKFLQSLGSLLKHGT